MKKLFIVTLLMSLWGAVAIAGELALPQESQRRSFLRGDVLEIDLRDAGKLHEYIGPGEDRRVRCIRLSGVINGDDIKFIKRLCVRSKAVDENDRNVDNYIDLELQRVRIVSGGSYSNRSERDVISNSMFSGCSVLRYVALPRDLRLIGDYAFSGCYKLEEVRFDVRSNVREIGNNAFSNCYNLTRINLPEGLEVIGNRCFNNCNSLKRIALPSTLLEIGSEAFAEVPLTDVRLPNYLTKLGHDVFKGTKITTLLLPRDVKVDNDSFGKMPRLREFQVERGSRYYSTEDGVLYDATGAVLICYPNSKSGSFSIPNDVTTLKSGAFAECVSLTGVTFPSSLLDIGAKAFDGCTSLGNVIIPVGVTSLGEEAFSHCDKMTTATIDAQLTLLPARAFESCGSLQSVVLPDGLLTIGEKAFDGCKSLINVEWGSSLKTIMKEAFRKCGFVQLELPQGIYSIGENTFRDCKSLRSIVLPGNLSVVEKELLRGCENLTQVSLPANAVTIGENAFRDCKSLPNIELPEGLSTINNNAFRGTALSTIVLPSTIVSVGEKIVEKCKMQSITCLAITPPVLKKISEKKTTLYVPEASIDAYKNVKPWKDFKNISGIDK